MPSTDRADSHGPRYERPRAGGLGNAAPHLTGFDHEGLTCRHAGRNYHLTDLSGRVVKELVRGGAAHSPATHKLIREAIARAE